MYHNELIFQLVLYNIYYIYYNDVIYFYLMTKQYIFYKNDPKILLHILNFYIGLMKIEYNHNEYILFLIKLVYLLHDTFLYDINNNQHKYYNIYKILDDCIFHAYNYFQIMLMVLLLFVILLFFS